MADEAKSGNWIDPFRSYNFKLEIKGVTQAHFTRCTGLGVKVQDIRYRQGGLSQVVHRIPGRVDYGDVCLEYGLTASNELWEWFNTVLDGKVVRKNVTVALLDSDGSTPKVRWDLIDCWPKEWRGAPLDALGNEAAIESLTLVFESLKQEK